jgi:asparagine synthase (glutamine-hydrolysing)
MCGLAGFLSLRPAAGLFDATLLEKMQQPLRHRGPNGYRVWSNNEHEVGMVHRRLSIVDLSIAAAQPMLDEQQQVVICVNGEIYNHQALRVELINLGYHFCSQSDSEVIVHGYKAWGMQRLLERLDGMFAFSLYDLITSECYLVRDRIGIKPLYFALQGDMLSFASEIKALWPLPWMRQQINSTALYHYATYMACPAPLTMYQDVYKIPAGFYLRIDAHKQMHVVQWYALHIRLAAHKNAPPTDENAYVEQLRTLLRSAVHKRLMADVPFGVALSGGIDSSLNLAFMAETTDQLKTFTVAFADSPELDELAWARKVAAHYGAEHHEIIINEADAADFFYSMIYHQDEPIADITAIPLYFVSKLMRDNGIAVALVGEGSDELFCGYDYFARYVGAYRWWKPTQQYIPDSAKRGLFYAAQKLAPSAFNRLDHLANWAHNRELFHSGVVLFSEYYKDQLFTFKPEPHDAMVERFFPGMRVDSSYAIADWYRAQLLDVLPQADVYLQMAYLELKHRLPELLLMRVDKMSMARAIEARVPYLDYRFVEFALQVPQQLKYQQGQTKYLLKRAAEGILPHDVIYRKKMGFSTPIARWFKDGQRFHGILFDLLATQEKRMREYCDVPKLRRMLQDHRVHKHVDNANYLWVMQNLMGFMRSLG